MTMSGIIGCAWTNLPAPRAWLAPIYSVPKVGEERRVADVVHALHMVLAA
jgi:hypothetical protein